VRRKIRRLYSFCNWDFCGKASASAKLTPGAVVSACDVKARDGYRRPLGAWAGIVCAENTHECYAGREPPIPVALKPDF
jgi:hypothetical protein